MAHKQTTFLSITAAAIAVLFSAQAWADNSDGLSQLTSSSNTLFILIGAVMILAMHSGFAFLEVGSVRKKNQVNALNKIIAEWGFSTLIYFFIGYPIARGISFMVPINEMAVDNGLDYVRFFLFLGFAACIPAIISGGVAERAKFWTNSLAGGIFVGLVYPFIEGATWGNFSGALGSADGWLATTFGAPFHDFAGSVVVHATGGWLALPAIILLGSRIRVAETDTIEVSSIPFLALGSWILIVGWFGFNVMSAGAINDISGLVAINSLLAMVGGTISALIVSKNDAGFVHNGALAGLVAVCAGSDLYHPVGALVVGVVAGLIFVFVFQFETSKLKIDDVLGVWPLHGLCGIWGGLAAGIFGLEALGGAGGVSFMSQLTVSIGVIAVALTASFVVYGTLKKTVGIRLGAQEERIGSDISIHSIASSPEDAF
ncbi:MAG: ammonium transporter [Deltaproteobacteria bacterium]|nr:ammonium transporter [Deltaproteobacteria bacterium]MBN2674310.1 ammonium transporter [Deltaproteobacteria bacterium]